jgi:hypothetical protein
MYAAALYLLDAAAIAVFGTSAAAAWLPTTAILALAALVFHRARAERTATA